MSDGEIRISLDRSLCVLCGGPNECALADPSATARAGDGASESSNSPAAEPCWCVERVFPEGLKQRAAERDGGASCICRACLEGRNSD